jgi:hypothetical protein
MMIDRPRYVGSAVSGSPTQTPNGRAEKSTRDTFSVRTSAPKRMACSRMRIISSGPVTPSGKPG